MTSPSNLSSAAKNILGKYGFHLTEYSDHLGMWIYYAWTNSKFQFSLTYDRGYYVCDVSLPNAGPEVRMSLIPLLKFLKNDPTLYNEELKEANLWNTLTPDGYVALLDKNYDMISAFFNDYDAEKFENYKKFNVDYDGI